MSLPNSSLTNHGFVVVGVNRSGTSALAAALSQLGVYFGSENDLAMSGQDLDYASFENRRIVDLGGAVLRALDRDGAPARGMPANWEGQGELADLVHQAAKFLQQTFGGHRLWGWKDPRSSLLIPFFERVFGELGVKPLYLMPVRHPVDVAKGLADRQGLSVTEGIGFWFHYTLTVLLDADPARLALVDFHELVSDPAKVLEPIWISHGLPAVQAEEWQRVRQAVRPESDRTRGACQDLPAIADRLWNLLGTVIAGKSLGAGTREHELLHEIADEWHEWTQLTRLPVVPVGEIRWMVAGEASSRSFKGERKWSPISIRLPAQAKGQVSVWFLPRFRVVRLRDLKFGPGPMKTPMRATATESAFAEFAPNGDLVLYSFGPTPHLTIEIPFGSGFTELNFEFLVEAGKHAATQIAQRLAGGYSSKPGSTGR
jgi:hypothetical protein